MPTNIKQRGNLAIVSLACLFLLNPATALAAESPRAAPESAVEVQTQLEDIVEEPPSTPYVYGGENVANPGWVAAITVGGSYNCAGSLIHQQWVLTAAHCAVDLDSSYRVNVGSSRWWEGQERSIVEAEIHPGYDPNDSGSVDLALVKLNSPVTGILLPSLASSPSWPVVNQVLIVVGWGETSTNSPPPDYLQGASVSVNSDSTGVPSESIFCNVGWVAASGFDDFCFGTNSAWACRGDSGGPLVGRSTPYVQTGDVNTLYGITSFGDASGCSETIYDTVAQSIGPHVSWINSTIPQPPSASIGDESFFYRSTDGAYRYYDMKADGALGSLLQGGTGYSKGWDSITAIDLDGDGTDESFFYRSTDGAYRYYKMHPDGRLGSLLQGGTGYSKGWDSITAIDLN